MTALRIYGGPQSRLDVPYRMYFSEVAEMAKLSKQTIREKIKRGEFPSPVDRGRELLFSGEAVYEALGKITKELSAEERLLKALE